MRMAIDSVLIPDYKHLSTFTEHYASELYKILWIIDT